MTAGLSYAALSAVLNPNMARCMGQQSAIAWGRRFCRHEDARCLKPSVDEICSYALSVGASLRSTGLTGTQAGNSAQRNAIWALCMLQKKKRYAVGAIKANQYPILILIRKMARYILAPNVVRALPYITESMNEIECTVQA